MSKPTSHVLLLMALVAGAASGMERAERVLAQTAAKPIQVTIDVKPGDSPTTLEPKREGMVPIAILSGKEFDATTVDPATVRGGAQGTEASIFRSAQEDIDNDRDVDMMLLFRVPDLKLTCQATSITVTGKTNDGKSFQGTEMVTMVGC